VTQISLPQFNSALTSVQATPLAEAPFRALLDKLGAERSQKLLADVASGNASAVTALQRYATIAGLYGRLMQIGVEATLDHARVILQNHPLDDIRATVVKALDGDANAVLVLRVWVDETNTDAVGARPTPAAATNPTPRTPAMPARASLPPPGSVAPVPAAPARPAQYQRPPTAQVTRIHPPADDEVAEPRTVTPRTYDQAKAHGGKAALTFAADYTQGGDPTVVIEAATMLNREQRTYDWSNKLRFQLTRHELQLVTALLFDMVPELHFSNHNDKWLQIKRQDNDPQYGGTIKFTMGLGKASENQPRTVQVDSSSLGEITSLFVRQCCSLLKCDGTILSPVLRQVAKTYLTQQACRGQQQRRAG
jgi:hypothetical protein